ncbi:MAG: MOSC domain-containing protein [Hyphomicrobium sp.]
MPAITRVRSSSGGAVTILAREDWEAALSELAASGTPVGDLDWTARRANLLVEGVRLPRAIGATLRIGPVLLEVTYPTTPCARMDEARDGLRKALHPEWRGGVTCLVLEGGHIAIGDGVDIIHAPPERQRKLP